MSRILIHVEGQTEEKFINELLRPHLTSLGFYNVSVRILGNARNRSNRGGIQPWNKLKTDLIRHLKSDTDSYCGLIVDYYGLPNDWPGRVESKKLSGVDKIKIIREGIIFDLEKDIGKSFDRKKFLPLIILHEFEALLFSDPKKFAEGICKADLYQEFKKIRDEFSSPEEINDSPISAPSKRILRLYPEYNKPLFGTLAALSIGIDTMRNECSVFDEWLREVEEVLKSEGRRS